jgi:asparagine synthase (glutamine-hydrolysing)
MAAGGPDGEGQFSDDPSGVSLGHRRLAIVDLTDAGRQPMIGQQGELVISYNGEIYNFKGLRDELHALGFPCVSRTDTEVILEEYACWGVQAFSKLEGMFALSLWDLLRQKV